MTSKAHVEFDPRTFGIRLALTRDLGARRVVITWPEPIGTVVDDLTTMPPEEAWLRLEEDDARAIYEALTDHFGHSGHDTRALRKDYDAERARVDRLIGAVIDARKP